MYLKKLVAFFKPHLKYKPIFVATILLSACEELSVSNEKPVFTIANMPFAINEKATQINDISQEVQTEETDLSEVKQSEQVSEPTRVEPVTKQAPSKGTNQTYTNLNNAMVIEKTKTANASKEAGSVPENMSEKSAAEKVEQKADLVENDLNTQSEIPFLPETLSNIAKMSKEAGSVPEKMSEKSAAEKVEQKADLIENDLNTQSEIPFLPTPLTSKEIAYLIGMPPSIYVPPPPERIRIHALLRSDDGELKSIMGTPNFVLRNGQMQLWQYDVGQCIIDFFLQQNKYGYIVTFIEIRAKILGDLIYEQDCETELAQALNS